MNLHFYSTSDEHGCFSNFSYHAIRLEGKEWPTVEHYFQASKFDNPKYQSKIQHSNTPNEAARLGRSRKVKIRNDWDKIKDNVMRKALLAKITQHKDIAKILLATGTDKIIEQTTDDKYWGRGTDGRGLNRLGTILEETREKLLNT